MPFLGFGTSCAIKAINWRPEINLVVVAAATDDVVAAAAAAAASMIWKE